jgi:hypothetical protein
MHNFSDPQVGQTAQRTTELGVEALSAGVGANLRRQASQEPFEGLRPVALQEEEVLELVYDPLDDLPLSRRPQPSGSVPRPLGVVLGGCGHQSPVLQEPVALPPNRGEALVGKISCVAVAVDEDLADGPLVGGGLRQAQGRYETLRSDRKADLQAVDPLLGLGGAPPEGGLSGEKPPPACPDPHHRGDEGRIEDVVDGTLLGEGSGKMERERLRLGLQSPRPAVELALGRECGEILAQMRLSESVKVPLAAEARPLALGEDRQREDFRVADERGAAYPRVGGGVGGLPPVFCEDVQ